MDIQTVKTVNKMSNNCYISSIPKHPLTKLDYQPNNSNTSPIKVFLRELDGPCQEIGVIQKINTALPIRWQDVELYEPVLSQTQGGSKRQKTIDHGTSFESKDQQSLRLLSQLPRSLRERCEYTQNPFTYGTDTIEEMLLVGAEKFKTIMNCYSYWFASCKPEDRILREYALMDMDSLTTAELQTFETTALDIWKQAHKTLMERKSATLLPTDRSCRKPTR